MSQLGQIQELFTGLLQSYPIPTVVAGCLVLLIIYKKPKGFLKFLLVLLAIYCGYYVLSMITDSMSSGVKGRHTDSTKSIELLDHDKE